MRLGEPAPRGAIDVDDLAPAVLLAREPVTERHAVDQLHREEHVALVRADIEHARDALVRELCHRLRLALQPGLERDVATAILA